MDDQLVETDSDRDTGDRFDRWYDDVYLPDGSLAPIMSVMDLVTDEDLAE